MRRTLYILIPLLLVAFATWHFTRPEPIRVTVVAVAKGDVETSVANTRAGTVHAHRRAGLAPSIGGQVAKLAVKEGDRVECGQVLIELWNADLVASLVTARHEAARAAAQADDIEVRAALADRQAARLEKLRAEDLAAEERLDRARSEAKALHASARAAKAHAAAQTARIAQVEAALERTVLKAPFAGLVAEVRAELGEYITPSPTGIPILPTIDLIDTTSLYVTAPIDEVDAPAVRAGMIARIKLDAFGKRVFAGKVRRVAPYVLDKEKQARTVDIEVEFTQVGDRAALLPGYSADVEVILATRNDVLRIPTDAILDGNRVLVFDRESGTLAERRIERGRENWRFTEVTSGLAAGDLAVTSLDAEGVVAGATAELETEQGTNR